jgi:hypothetical protein
VSAADSEYSPLKNAEKTCFSVEKIGVCATVNHVAAV